MAGGPVKGIEEGELIYDEFNVLGVLLHPLLHLLKLGATLVDDPDALVDALSEAVEKALEELFRIIAARLVIVAPGPLHPDLAHKLVLFQQPDIDADVGFADLEDFGDVV